MDKNAGLCPLEGRRQFGELAYSLLATYVAAFVAYAHLEHSLRGNKKPMRVLIAFGVFPAFPIWLGLCSFIEVLFLASLNYSVYLDRGQAEEVGTSQGALYVLSAWLNIPVQERGNNPRSTTLLRHARVTRWAGDYHYQLENQEESEWVRFGQMSIIAFTAMQCVGSSVRGYRRLQHGQDSVILIDAAILWVALSGSFVLFQSLCVLVLNKKWTLRESSSATTDIFAIHPTDRTSGVLAGVLSVVVYTTLILFNINPIWVTAFSPILYVMNAYQGLETNRLTPL